MGASPRSSAGERSPSEVLAILRGQGPSCALEEVQQHPWPLPTGCGEPLPGVTIKYVSRHGPSPWEQNCPGLRPAAWSSLPPGSTVEPPHARSPQDTDVIGQGCSLGMGICRAPHGMLRGSRDREPRSDSHWDASRYGDGRERRNWGGRDTVC